MAHPDDRPDLLDRTRAVLGRRARRELTRDQAAAALHNLTGAMSLLVAWDREDRLAALTKETPHG